MLLVLTSLLSRVSFWIQFFFSGLLKAWEIFWRSSASTAFMAGACLVLLIVLIIGLAERRMELTTAELLAQAGYLPQRRAAPGEAVPRGEATEEAEAQGERGREGLWTKICRGIGFLSLAFRGTGSKASSSGEGGTVQVEIPMDTASQSPDQEGGGAEQHKQQTEKPETEKPRAAEEREAEETGHLRGLNDNAKPA